MSAVPPPAAAVLVPPPRVDDAPKRKYGVTADYEPGSHGFGEPFLRQGMPQRRRHRTAVPTRAAGYPDFVVAFPALNHVDDLVGLQRDVAAGGSHVHYCAPDAAASVFCHSAKRFFSALLANHLSISYTVYSRRSLVV